MTKPRVRIDREGWIRHDGGACPVPDRYVHLRFKDDAPYVGDPEKGAYWSERWWQHSKDATFPGNHITHYRIVSCPA